MLSLFTTTMGTADTRHLKVREPAVSGMFYPASPEKLKALIQSYLRDTEKLVEGQVGGLIAPHAGYVYSGPVAAWSFKQVEGESYPVVVVIAPSHFEYFEGLSVFDGASYRTPLGDIPIARDLAIRLTEASPHIRLSEAGHAFGYGNRGEHALEVELPFLQQVLGEFKLIPVVMGSQDWLFCEEGARAIYQVFRGQKVLLVASSDLSHYHPYEVAYKMDEQLLELFEQYQYKALLEQSQYRKIEACGAGPIATVMFASELLGYKKARVLKYATSGDVPHGERSQVVGYMAGALYK